MAVTQLATDYAPVVYEFFKTGVESVPSMIPSLFNVQGSQMANEYHIGVGGAQIEVWDEYNQTGVTGHADIDRGYATTFTHKDKTARFALKKNHITDVNGMNVVQEMLMEMGISYAQRRETDAASVFINAFSSSFVGADGVALCSASHPQGPDDTGTTYSNTGTTAFSYTALTTARTNLRSLVDQQGQPLMRNGTLILHPIELQTAVDEVLFATGKPGTANNDGSSARGFSAMAWDYLTNAKDWWLIDPLYMRRHLIWYDRQPLTMMVVDETTTDIVYEFKARYSYGWRDPRWLYGNDVA